jgi:tocopherol O-methyltransferase
VARHYDELDPFYRDIWGEHVHHGLWLSGDETPERAVEQLVEHVAGALALRADEAVIDVGAGYGGTARRLASLYGVHVTGLTVSAAQHAHAQRASQVTRGSANVLLRDWLSNELPSGSADAIVAIESTEHMADLPLALAEMRRVLRPGGRVAICAWLAGDGATAWQRRFLLHPICRESRLATLTTAGAFDDLLRDAGFTRVAHEDLTGKVRRTWAVCLRRLVHRALTDGRYWRYGVGAGNRERVFLAAMLRIQVAFALGAMRYGLFVGKVSAPA